VTPVLLSLLTSLALVQTPPASLGGSVRDRETGAPLPGAIIALPELNRSTSADASGRYLLPGVPAGPQHITVRFLGYAPHVLHALVPPEGALELNVSLPPVPLRLQTIRVHPPVAVRGAEPGATEFPDRSASIAAVRNHPAMEREAVHHRAHAELAHAVENMIAPALGPAKTVDELAHSANCEKAHPAGKVAILVSASFGEARGQGDLPCSAPGDILVAA